MRHFITSELTNPEFKEKLRNGLRGFTVRFLFQFLIPLSGFAQENPWATQSSEENPWEAQQELSIESDSTTNSSLISSEYKSFVFKNDTVLIPADNQELIDKTLKDHGKSLDKSNGYFALGYAGGIATTVFGYPVCVGLSQIETKKSKQHIEDFKKANPEASQREVKKVKLGLSTQRAKKAFLGVTAGIGTWVVIAFTAIVTAL